MVIIKILVIAVCFAHVKLGDRATGFAVFFLFIILGMVSGHHKDKEKKTDPKPVGSRRVTAALLDVLVIIAALSFLSSLKYYK